MEKLLSIIIPVYNTGAYLEKCLQSVCEQTVNDIEVIIVDDGSDVETASLCDTIATRDNRIRVIHKKNEGVSVARNVGLKLATGRFLGFVDSDDKIAPDMFKRLTDIAITENADIVMCDALTVRTTGKTIEDTFTQLSASGFVRKSQIVPQVLCEVAGAVWRCIYKRKLIAEYQISFPIGLKLSEDRIFNIEALGRANGFFYLKRPLYYRYIREGSASFSYHSDAAYIITHAHRCISKLLSELWSEEYNLVYKHQELALFYGSMNAINLAKGLTVRIYYEKMHKLCHNSELLNVLMQTNANDLRARLVRNNQIAILCVLTYLLGIKHTFLLQ